MAQKFPTDRFDAIPADLERVGAHRAPRSRGAGWMWLLWCAVAVVIIVGAGWIYLRVLDGNISFVHPTSSSTAADTDTGTPSPSSTPTPTVQPTVVADAQITVLNATDTNGLATTAVKRLSEAGWSNAGTANASAKLATTTIYYSDPADEGIAKGVAQTITGAAVQLSNAYADSGDAVTVVLGSDFH